MTLRVGAELAPKCLAVRLTAQSGRDLVPGPVSGSRFPHGQRKRLLRDPSSIGGAGQEFFHRRHAIDYGTKIGTPVAGIRTSRTTNGGYDRAVLVPQS